MGISQRLKSARQLLLDARARQQALLDRAAGDEAGRTLSSIEGDEYDLLASEAKSLAAEIRMLEERLEMEAATARPPNRDPDRYGGYRDERC